MNCVWYIDSPWGLVGIRENGHAITALFLGKQPLQPYETLQNTPLLMEAAGQLEEYMAGKRKAFTLPLEPKGTPFQQKVWKALIDIPYGETRSYKQIAQAVNCPSGYRAVGMANNKNPIAIIIPCHRVVGSGGTLTGYAYGLSMKEELLALEGASL